MNVYGKFWKKNNKVAPETNLASNPNVKVNNYAEPSSPSSISIPEDKTRYFFLIGSAEIFLGKFKTGDNTNNIKQPAPKPSLFQKVAKRITSHNFAIPAESLCETEEQAFKQAVEQYGTLGHAISIFKLVIPSDEIHERVATIDDGTKQKVVSPNLAFIETIKSFSTKLDSKELKNAKTFKKVERKDAELQFEEVTPNFITRLFMGK
jgi:hypothetical protein